MNQSIGTRDEPLTIQLSTTSAQEERDQFSGDVDQPTYLGEAPLPPGQYRVIAGELYRIGPGIPESVRSGNPDDR